MFHHGNQIEWVRYDPSMSPKPLPIESALLLITNFDINFINLTNKLFDQMA